VAVTFTPVDTRDLYIKEIKAGNVQIAPDYLSSLTDRLNRDANGDAPSVATNDVDAVGDLFASGVLNAMQQIGGSLGLAILSTVAVTAASEWKTPAVRLAPKCCGIAPKMRSRSVAKRGQL